MVSIYTTKDIPIEESSSSVPLPLISEQDRGKEWIACIGRPRGSLPTPMQIADQYTIDQTGRSIPVYAEDGKLTRLDDDFKTKLGDNKLEEQISNSVPEGGVMVYGN